VFFKTESLIAVNNEVTVKSTINSAPWGTKAAFLNSSFPLQTLIYGCYFCFEPTENRPAHMIDNRSDCEFIRLLGPGIYFNCFRGHKAQEILRTVAVHDWLSAILKVRSAWRCTIHSRSTEQSEATRLRLASMGGLWHCFQTF
jgi:hypothetical protein